MAWFPLSKRGYLQGLRAESPAAGGRGPARGQDAPPLFISLGENSRPGGGTSCSEGGNFHTRGWEVHVPDFWKVFRIETLRLALDALRVANRSPTPTSVRGRPFRPFGGVRGSGPELNVNMFNTFQTAATS